MSESTPKRPAIISESTRDDLTTLRGFRNVERHNYPSFLDKSRTLDYGKMLFSLHPRFALEIRQFLDLLRANSTVGNGRSLEAEKLKNLNRSRYKVYFERVSSMKPAVGIFTRWENQEKADIAIVKMILSENQDLKQAKNLVRQVLSQSDRVIELRQGTNRNKIGEYIETIFTRAKSRGLGNSHRQKKLGDKNQP